MPSWPAGVQRSDHIFGPVIRFTSRAQEEDKIGWRSRLISPGKLDPGLRWHFLRYRKSFGRAAHKVARLRHSIHQSTHGFREGSRPKPVRAQSVFCLHPGSPLINKTCPWPAAARCQSAFASSISRMRPTQWSSLILSSWLDGSSVDAPIGSCALPTRLCQTKMHIGQE